MHKCCACILSKVNLFERCFLSLLYTKHLQLSTFIPMHAGKQFYLAGFLIYWSLYLYLFTKNRVINALKRKLFGNTCYLLLATCYLLLATCYLLLATCYLILATCYLLLATCYLLLKMVYYLFCWWVAECVGWWVLKLNLMLT